MASSFSSSLNSPIVNSLSISPDDFDMVHASAAKTAALLADTESAIEDMKQLRDELIPEHCTFLTQEIRNNKQSTNLLLLTAHVSLRAKIAYEQQRRTVTRQTVVLAEIEGQKAQWASVLEKAKEQKKQLKRLQKLQQEYAITSRVPDCDEECLLGLKKRMMVALDRCLRAKRAYAVLVQQVKADTDRLMEENSEWRLKQEELNKKAKERANEVARKQKEAKVRVKANGEGTGPRNCKPDNKNGKGAESKTKYGMH